MKLACSTASYDVALRSGAIDLPGLLKTAAEDLEVDGVEFLDTHLPTIDRLYLRDIKRMCTDLQLTIAGLAITNDFGPEQRRALETERVRHWCDVAAYLGAPVVRVFGGWTPEPPQDYQRGVIVQAFRAVFGQRPAVNARRLWSDVTWALRQCADHAAEAGVTIALQNSRSHGGVVGTWQQLAQCVHDVGSPWLRVCLDPIDFGDSPRFDDVLRKTVQVRARLRDVAPDGADTAAYWPELLRGLKASRYRGFVVMEYEGDQDPLDVMPRASSYMRGVLQIIARQQMLQAAMSATGAAPAEKEAAVPEPAPPVAPEAQPSSNESPRSPEEERLLQAQQRD